MTAWAGWSPKRASGRPTNPARTGRSCRNRRPPRCGSISPTRTTVGPPAIRRRCWSLTMAAASGNPSRRPSDPPGAAGSLGLLVDRLRQPELRHYFWIQSAGDALGLQVSGVDGPGGCVEPPRDAAPLVHHGDARRRPDLAGRIDVALRTGDARALFGQRPRPRADRDTATPPPTRARSTSWTGRPARIRPSSATSAMPSPMSG